MNRSGNGLKDVNIISRKAIRGISIPIKKMIED